jgi:hypothetical protein
VRFRLALTAAVATLCVVCTPLPANAATGAYWGTYVEPPSGQSPLGALTSFESVVGRRFHMYRFYRPIDNGDLGNDVASTMKRRGDPVYLNINSQFHGRCVSWRNVAAGRYNHYLHIIARHVRAYRYRVYFSWNHEMENNCSTGTAREYRASYGRIRRIFRKEHVTNARWVVVFAASNFTKKPASVVHHLPRRYDMIGVDGYNRARKWRTATQIFGAAHRFASNHGTRLFIGEIGCEENPSDPMGKANWLMDAANTFKRWNVAVVLWTNSRSGSRDYRADTSSDALAAYKQVGAMSFFDR